jgi:hypothetical protein
MRGLLTLVPLLTVLVAPPTARTQGSPFAPRAGDRLWGTWMGASLRSPVDTYWGGTTPGRSLVLVGLRAHYVVETVGPVALAFTADLVPAAVVSNNPRWRWRVRVYPEGEYEYKEITDSGRVYGAGLSPIGLHVSAPVWSRVRAYAAGAVGGLWFTREMPLPEARSFNYSLEIGGGLDVAAGATHVVVIGFKFHHLSNMNTALANPGLDGHVFYIGLLRRRRPLR